MKQVHSAGDAVTAKGVEPIFVLSEERDGEVMVSICSIPEVSAPAEKPVFARGTAPRGGYEGLAVIVVLAAFLVGVACGMCLESWK